MYVYLETNLTNKLGVVMQACHSSQAGSVNRMIMVQGSLDINVRLYLKNT
jgi:hypothetical protein